MQSQVFALRLNREFKTLWMQGLKEIDLFLLKELLDSSGFKYPFIPENPYALFGLPCHRLNVARTCAFMARRAPFLFLNILLGCS